MTNALERDGIRAVQRGKVWLVGAGPGDPELMTVRAARLVADAEVLAYDELVPEAILNLAPKSAERIPVGRRAGGCRHHEARIHPLVITRAIEGRDVVRLKGGDPFVFGRGGEEAEELAAARVPFEVVPGVSAALAAAASTNIPLTYREVAASVTFATAHRTNERRTDVANASSSGTLVLYMGLGQLAATMSELVLAGRSPNLPAAIVSNAGRHGTRSVTATVGTLAHEAALAGLEAPAVVIVGDVVARATRSPAAVPHVLLEPRSSAR